MSQPRYVIGIDLGTTNCCAAWAEVREEAGALDLPPVTLLPIPQLAHPGEIVEETLLPSFLYFGRPNEFPNGTLDLPWRAEARLAGGRLAERRGVENARRLVNSAKSWLCLGSVDRTAKLLPLNAPDDVEKISPVDASARYLEHIREAWDARMSDAPFEEQSVLVTVPASFDAVGRDLTEAAAKRAGFRGITILEEPQAAFYAWIERHPDWRQRVVVGDLILVVDIGGGTTDFTLIAVTERGGELALDRVAVGEHILLGGDNMDLGLAHLVSQRLAAKGTKLDAMQMHALAQHCRSAKEKLLEENGPEELPVTILGRGTGLVGGTIRASLSKADLHQVFLDGFFPRAASNEMPLQPKRAGLQEIGLPFAADAAVTRHLAKFLRQQAAASEHGAVRRSASGMACPSHVLFNGGVLRAGIVRERLLETLNSWLSAEGAPGAKALPGEDLMHAVARGAAYYGLARSGKGVRIRGGVPRTYYVGIESSAPAVPGFPPPMKALTVAGFGMEEGTSHKIPGREFGLIVDAPSEFRFFCSATRKNDQPGEVIEDFGDELEELTPMDVTLPSEGSSGEMVPVTVETVVTETGMLQLWCVARDGRRWKLEFNVREKVDA